MAMLRAAQAVEAMDGGTTEVRAEHIVAGNQQAVLALLWAAAVRFEVRLARFPPTEDFAGSSARSAGFLSPSRPVLTRVPFGFLEGWRLLYMQLSRRNQACGFDA